VLRTLFKAMTLQLVVEEILQTLPVSQRTMIELRIEDYEINEIAEKTGRAKRSIERALQDFRTKLSNLIHEDA
jgi:DNA-directed RNA polymerase specialized sigma24 family protein